MRQYIALPEEYRPYSKIVICGNTLINVQIPFEVEGQVPLLIGNDGNPKIWLIARFLSHPNVRWQPIVSRNRSLHNAVSLTGADTENISITVGGTIILSLHKRSDGIPEVMQLDLRPIGLKIYGDNSKLFVGSNEFYDNTFENLKVMVEIGE